MGGGGFLYHMKKSLEGNRALLKKRGHFNNANEHETSRHKTIFKFKNASKAQLAHYRILAANEEGRQKRKALNIGLSLLAIMIITMLIILLNFSDLRF